MDEQVGELVVVFDDDGVIEIVDGILLLMGYQVAHQYLPEQCSSVNALHSDDVGGKIVEY